MAKRRRVLPGATVSALLLAATQVLGMSAGQVRAQTGGTFVMAYQGDVPTLSPVNGGGYESSQASAPLYDGLVTYAPSMTPRIVPDLAQSWKVEDGGRVYVFRLRSGVRYANGDPFKPQDIIYNFEQQLNPHNASWAESFYQGIEGGLAYSEGKAKTISGMQVLGPHTLKITLTQPEGYFLNILAMPTSYIADPRIEQEYGKAYQDHAVGTGPYKLVKWVHNSLLVETVNPYYWGPKPRIPEIKFILGPSPTTIYEMFQKGEVDALSPVPSNLVVPTLRNPVLAKEFYTVANTGSLEYYFMDVTYGPFRSRLVRQALNLAVDRRRLVQLQAGQATPANQYLPPGYPGYEPHLPPIPFDPAEARTLLAKAGYKHGLSLTLSVNNDPNVVQRAESVIQNLAAVGVKVTLDTMSLSAYDTALSEGKIKFGVIDWGMDYPDPQDILQSSLTGTQATGDMANWNSPAFIRLLNEANALPPSQDARRYKLYDQAQAIALQAAPWIPLFYPNTTILISNQLSPPASDPKNLGYYLNPVLPISVQDLSFK
jgi:ABC-type transport system substrate-binding protein